MPRFLQRRFSGRDLPAAGSGHQRPAATPAAATGQPAAKAVEKATTTDSTDPIERIKEEGLKHSQVMATLSYLTDVIGPRLTGSPNMKRANEWTRDKLAAWGLANAHLEAWGPFGRGWSLKRFSAQVIEPQCIPLIGFPKAWSPGIDGTLVAPVVYFDAKTEADFAAYKGKLKGAIVLTSPIREVAARWEPLANRKTDSELLALADAAEPECARSAAAGDKPRAGERPASRGPAAAAAAPPPRLPTAAAGGPASQRDGSIRPRCGPRWSFSARRRSSWPRKESPCWSIPALRATAARSSCSRPRVPGAPLPDPGQTGGRRVSAYDKDAPKITPQIVLAKEHYNRLVRMCEQGENSRWPSISRSSSMTTT